jgi:hypothetical protein
LPQEGNGTGAAITGRRGADYLSASFSALKDRVEADFFNSFAHNDLRRRTGFAAPVGRRPV